MSWAELAPPAYLGAASLYAGFQLTIRGVVYPQMANVPERAWVGYEAAHQRRVSLMVGPLFAVLLFACGFLVLGGDHPRSSLLAVLLLAGILIVTAGGAVPQHRALSTEFDAVVHARLLRWDTVRLVLALSQVALALALFSP